MEVIFFYTIIKEVGDFPGGPLVETAFQCRGCRFDPWSGS